MRHTLRLAALAAGLLAVGCGDGTATVKGRLLENGQPIKVPPTTVAVELAAVGPDGKVDPGKDYTAVVAEDGTFQVVASGGAVQPGTYRLGIIATGASADKFKSLASADSHIKREIKPGANDLTIDVAKP